MKKIILTSLLVASPSLFATTVSMDSCDIRFKGDISMSQQQIQLTLENGEHLIIDPAGSMQLNGQFLNLDSEQQEWARTYHHQLSTAAPMTASIALDAIDLAQEAVGEVLQMLLGKNYINPELDEKLSELRLQVEQQFYADNGSFHFRSNHFEDTFLDSQWEEELSEIIEDSIRQSMGSLMINLGSELLFGGGNLDSFESKMENMASDLEYRMESRAEQIEQRAEALCIVLEEANHYEDQLNQSVQGLQQMDLLSQRVTRDKM